MEIRVGSSIIVTLWFGHPDQIQNPRLTIQLKSNPECFLHKRSARKRRTSLAKLCVLFTFWNCCSFRWLLPRLWECPPTESCAESNEWVWKKKNLLFKIGAAKLMHNTTATTIYVGPSQVKQISNCGELGRVVQESDFLRCPVDFCCLFQVVALEARKRGLTQYCFLLQLLQTSTFPQKTPRTAWPFPKQEKFDSVQWCTFSCSFAVSQFSALACVTA